MPGKSSEGLGCFPIVYRWIVCQNVRIASSLISGSRSTIIECRTTRRGGIWEGMLPICPYLGSVFGLSRKGRLRDTMPALSKIAFLRALFPRACDTLRRMELTQPGNIGRADGRAQLRKSRIANRRPENWERDKAK